jgi:hypothetical protein
MSESIASQIQTLRKMTVSELREKHLELFGTESRSRHKDQLFKRLAWRIQELEFGGLSERAKRRAEVITNDLDARFLPPRKLENGQDRPHEVVTTRVRCGGSQPTPGTILQREYRGEVHEVTVHERGFEYGGKAYRSLSGVARAITGTHWNGYLFFGVKGRGASDGRR